MKDTLNTVKSQMADQSFDALDILSNVNTFYNNAWDKLILVGTVAFAIVGIVIPLVIQWYQRKTLKLSEELLKKEIKNQISKIKSELLQELETSFAEKLKQHEDKIEEHSASVNAKAFHIQANMLIEKHSYQNALGDFIVAAEYYLSCNDYQNLLVVLNAISSTCLPQLSLEEVEDLKITSKTDIYSLLEDLEKKNEKGAISQPIREIKFMLQKLPKKISDKNPKGEKSNK